MSGYEMVKCTRCGKPIGRVAKMSDYGDICYSCLSQGEKDEMDTPEFKKSLNKELKKYM